MQKSVIPMREKYYRKKHHERMTRLGLEPTEVYCRTEDIENLKIFVENLNQQHGVGESWFVLPERKGENR
jgi:hypothetical protein